MSRPKGSKNKPKDNAMRFQTKADVMPAVPVHQKPWQPEPDMGQIKPPTPQEAKCKACPHLKKTHYGSERNWCNVGGCDCQAFAE